MNEQPILDKTPDIIIPPQKAQKKSELNNQYLLTKFPFDPTKQSPPNNFLLKLAKRLNHHGLDNLELVDA